MVELSKVRLKVLEFARGAPALRALERASSANHAPPAGREHAIVRVELTGVASGQWVGCSALRLVGAERIVYSHGGQIPPDPPLESTLMQAGRVSQGWCTYSIRSNDRGLILIVEVADLRYVALEPGASLEPFSAEPDVAMPPIGESPLSPAQPGSEVVTRNWSVEIIDVVRGDDARHLVETANPRNAAPADGLEFLAIKLHARYHGRSGRSGLLSPSSFQVIRRDGRPYDAPIVLDVTPRLSRTLFPGGEHTGWAVFQVGRGDFEAVLRFTPYYPDSEVRYLALTESSA